MSYKDYIISSAITFEVSCPAAKSKLLHKIASGIQGDGFKIKRIAVFEKPFSARIYIEDLSIQPKVKPWYLQILMSTPDTDIDAYDYLISLSIKERSLLEFTCAYSIEHHNNFHSHKPHVKTQIARMGQFVSESITTSLRTSGVKLLTTIGATTPDNTANRPQKKSINTVPIPMSGIRT